MIEAEWMSDAACRGVDMTVFFPEGRQNSDIYAEAESYCQRCPVVEQCLSFALEVVDGGSDSHRFGMFGGKRPGERRSLVRRGAA